MYVYHSLNHNVVLFTTYYRDDTTFMESMLGDLIEFLGKIDKDFNQAKMFIANNDCFETTVNSINYIQNDEPENSYNVEYKTLEMTIFPDKREVSLWLGMNDGFMVYATLNMTLVGEQIVLFELH